jgi:hypothetical protein
MLFVKGGVLIVNRPIRDGYVGIVQYENNGYHIYGAVLTHFELKMSDLKPDKMTCVT